MTASSYDGRKPEPPYHTDSDIVVDLQGQIDELTAERDHLRADLQRLQSSPAPVVGGVPELTDEEVRDAWYAVEQDPEQIGDAYQDGVRYGYALAASRLPAIKPGEVKALEVLRRIAETKLEEDDDDYEMDMDIAFAKLSEIVNDCRDAIRAQATTSGEETPC